MARYIDADEFLNEQIRRCGCVPLVGSCTMDNESLRDVLAFTPTAEVVEVKHGEWLENYHEDWMGNPKLDFKCSSCGFVSRQGAENYCARCGAKMDGKQQKEGD